METKLNVLSLILIIRVALPLCLSPTSHIFLFSYAHYRAGRPFQDRFSDKTHQKTQATVKGYPMDTKHSLTNKTNL